MRILFVAILLLVSSIASGARADLAIDIGNAEGRTNPILVNAGNQVSVPFVATPSVVTNLSGFNLSIEFGQSSDGNGNGFGLGGNFERSNFSLSEIPGEFGGTLAIAPDTTGPVFFDANGLSTNFDFLVSGNGSTQTFQPGQAFGLFNLVIDVPGNATLGIYDVRFELIPTPTNINGNSPGDVGFSVFQGSIEVTAVPEPSAAALLILVACSIGINRRRS